MRAIATILLILFAAQVTPHTAREYYNEIYAAGGLDRMADGEVCFDDDPNNKNFFIFGQSAHIREFMQLDGSFSRMSKEFQARFNKDFLIVRGYARGIPFDSDEFYEKSGNSWVSPEYQPGKPSEGYIRVRLTINWQTLRYKRAVEMLGQDLSYKSEIANWGRCEDVKPGAP